MSTQRPPQRGWFTSIVWRFVAWFLKLLYTKLAWAYDLVATVTSVGQWWHWQQAVVEELPAGRLLELGVGTSRLLSNLLSQGHAIYGLDSSRQMVQISRRRLKQRGLLAPLIQGDARQLPFKDGSFSAVYATFPSDYLFMQTTLHELGRVLQPAGLVIFIPFAVIRGSSLLDRAASLLYRLTGQAPNKLDTDWLDQIELPGFEVGYTRVEQTRAQVLRVTLKKSREWSRDQSCVMENEGAQ